MQESDSLSPAKPHKARLPLPPGPKGTLIQGVMPEFTRDSLAFITRCRGYGDVVRMRFLYQHVFFLYSPNHIEAVLSTNAKNFIKARTLRTPFFQRLVGNGLLTSEGEDWRRQRRLAQPAFHRSRISGYGDVMVEYAERLIAQWPVGEERDIYRDMMRLTLEIAAKTLFNADVSSDADKVGQVLSQMVKPFASQATLKWILDNRLPTRAHREFFAAAKEIDAIVYRIIGERRASGRDEGDLLSMLLTAHDEDDGSQMTDRQLRDEVMTIFLAGHETTALTLSWTWYLLAQSPAVEAKLHLELDAVLGDRSATFEDFGRLVYTEMILAEALRLYPPGWRISRRVIADHSLGGYTLPAGSLVFLSQYVTHRDARYYPDPSRFDPERWTAPAREARPPFAYYPFSGGTRRCLGEQFARMSGVLLLATLAGQWKLRLVPGARIETDPLFTLRPKFGMPMTLRRRRPLPGNA